MTMKLLAAMIVSASAGTAFAQAPSPVGKSETQAPTSGSVIQTAPPSSPAGRAPQGTNRSTFIAPILDLNIKGEGVALPPGVAAPVPAEPDIKPPVAK